MKVKLLSLLSLISTYNLAQEIPKLNINDLTPKWYHILQDTNFVQDTFGLNIRTPFSICFPFDHQLVNGQLFINNHCTTGLGDRNGNLIQNINVKTGIMNWTRALNNDNYLVNQEFYPSMFYDQDLNQVILKGFRKYGSPSTSGIGWIAPQPSLFSTIILDNNNGNINNHLVNQNLDTIRWRPILNTFMRTQAKNDWYIRSNFTPGDGLLYTLDKITDEQNLITNSSLTYLSETISDLPFYSIGNNLLGIDNNDHFYGIAIQKENYSTKPFNAHLLKFRINDKGDFMDTSLDLIYKKDIAPYIQTPESAQGFFVNSRIYDDVMYLSMVFTDTLDNQKIKRWLLALDKNGNELFYINALTIDGINFPQAITFIGRKNGKLYFTLSGNDLDYSRILVSVDDKGNLQKYKTIRSGDSDSKINGLRCVISDQDDLVISMQVNNMYYYSAAYNAKDFGIDFTNSIAEYKYSKEYHVYPNPASNIVLIESKNPIPHTISLSNSLGKELIIEYNKDPHYQIDLSILTPGIYYLKFQSDEKSLIQVEKIIKI